MVLDNTMKQIVLSLLAVLPFSVLAEGNLSLQLIPGGYGHDSQRLFSQGAEPSWQNQLDENLHLRWQYSGFILQAGVEAQQIYDGDSTSKGFLYELFYDFSLASLDLCLGKKQMPMGVGYAYRPLDMIQQEQRQTLRPVMVEGVPVVSVEKYTETGTAGLIYVNHINWDEENVNSGKDEWAVKGYSLIGNYDLQWLLHYDEQRKTSAAFGFSWVGGESTELHASIRVQGEYRDEPELAFNPVTQVVTETPVLEQNGIIGLIGMTWTNSDGLSVIAEYWYDERAASDNYWKEAIDDLAYLKSGVAVNASNAMQMATVPNRFAYAANQSNLKENNLFLRVSYDGESFDPAIDMFYHPNDDGYMMTLRADKEVSQNQRLSFAYRYYGGNRESTFGNVGDDQQLMLMWEVYSATQ